MPPDKDSFESSRSWLTHVNGHFALTRQPKSADASWEDQCFLAQQATEKAFKAVYRHMNLRFRYTRDLEELGGGLEAQGAGYSICGKGCRDADALCR